MVGHRRLGAGSAAGDETGEAGPPGGLAGRLITQVETPSDVIGLVFQRGVFGEAVQEQNIPRFHLHRDPVAPDDRFGNVDSGGENLARAVRGPFPPVGSRRHYQTAVFHGGVGDRRPCGQHFGFVPLRIDHRRVLVPVGGGYVGVGVRPGQGAAGRLEAGVLHRVAKHLRADHRLGDVQQPRVGQQAEDGRAGVQSRIFGQVAQHGQGNVQVLVEQVHVVQLPHRLNVTLGEPGGAQGPQHPFCRQFGAGPFQNAAVFVPDVG